MLQLQGTLHWKSYQAHQAKVDAAVAALKDAGDKAVVVSGIEDKELKALSIGYQ